MFGYLNLKGQITIYVLKEKIRREKCEAGILKEDMRSAYCE
jgi:hypothetical protein